MSFELSELDRRLANIIRFGQVSEIDLAASPPAVKVELDDGAPTDWLPWITRRAGRTRHWSPPDIGEAVVLLSPSGELAQARVLPGSFYDDFPANGDGQDLDRVTYPDGSVVEYDSAAHHLTVTVGTGQVTVNCSQATVNAATKVKLDTPLVHCTHDLVVDGTALIKQQLTGRGGMAISNTAGGPAATLEGGLEVTGGDVMADDISLKGHSHDDPQGGTVGDPIP